MITLFFLDISILLPEHVYKAKQIKVQIELENITISENEDNPNIILSGKLSNKCKYADVVWAISGRKLHITLDKIKEIWWERLFETEPKLDTRNFSSTRNIDELPPESQAIIEKLRWEEEQKYNGRPLTEQEEILKKSWNVKGSPFAGQPFDPSLVTFK